MAPVLEGVHQFVELLGSSDDPVYKVIHLSNGKVEIHPTALSGSEKVLRRLFNYDCPRLELSENLKIAQRAIQGLDPVVFLKPKQYSIYHDRPNAEVINEMADWIRQRIRDPAIRRVIRARELKSFGQFVSAKRYIDHLYSQYRRLLVLRFDLGYREHVTVQKAKADLKHLLDNRRGKVDLFKPMVGYIARMEYGADKGIHFHVIFFFDGDKSWKDAWLVRQVGKYWQDVITKGQGIHYNCNKGKKRYRRCGIGMIKREAENSREDLLEAVSYLTKMDQYIGLNKECGRVFFRGVLGVL